MYTHTTYTSSSYPRPFRPLSLVLSFSLATSSFGGEIRPKNINRPATPSRRHWRNTDLYTHARTLLPPPPPRRIPLHTHLSTHWRRARCYRPELLIKTVRRYRISGLTTTRRSSLVVFHLQRSRSRVCACLKFVHREPVCGFSYRRRYPVKTAYDVGARARSLRATCTRRVRTMCTRFCRTRGNRPRYLLWSSGSTPSSSHVDVRVNV